MPHISLVLREMWDTTAPSTLNCQMHCSVNIRGIPHLAKNERDVGHPAFLSDQIFPTAPGGNSQARHKYHLATDRQGFHFAARRSICSGLGSISAVMGLPALTLPKVKRYPLRTP